MFLSRLFCLALTAITLFGGITECFGWGKDGHTAIGTLAIDQLQPHARSELESIIQPGPLDGLAMAISARGHLKKDAPFALPGMMKRQREQFAFELRGEVDGRTLTVAVFMVFP